MHIRKNSSVKYFIGRRPIEKHIVRVMSMWRCWMNASIAGHSKRRWIKLMKQLPDAHPTWSTDGRWLQRCAGWAESRQCRLSPAGSIHTSTAVLPLAPRSCRCTATQTKRLQIGNECAQCYVTKQFTSGRLFRVSTCCKRNHDAHSVLFSSAMRKWKSTGDTHRIQLSPLLSLHTLLIDVMLTSTASTPHSQKWLFVILINQKKHMKQLYMQILSTIQQMRNSIPQSMKLFVTSEESVSYLNNNNCTNIC